MSEEGRKGNAPCALEKKEVLEAETET